MWYRNTKNKVFTREVNIPTFVCITNTTDMGLTFQYNTLDYPIYILSKPIGAACNLKCSYCYYLEKDNLRSVERFSKMSESVLDAFIRQYIEAQPIEQVLFTWHGGEPSFQAESFRRIPLFSFIDDDIVNRLAKRFQLESVDLGSNLIQEGKDHQKFFIVAKGQVEILSKGTHGENLRIALLSEGEYFGEADILSDKRSSVTVRSITPAVFFTLNSAELENIIKEVPNFREQFQKAVDEHLRVKATVNAHGEKHIDLVSGHEEDNIIPETYIDYEEQSREYSLNTLQTVVRVHTRVSDLYNNPFNQLEQQMRLSIESIKERQEWELINNKKFGLLSSVDPAYRISTRYGAPTPDDLDELLSLVWKGASFFIAHPRAIDAFERECTWRGVPIIPSDKVEIQGQYLTNRGVGTTNFILVRTGENEQGIVGLHQAGIPGEIAPSLSARLMGLDKFGVASYLLTKYFSLASLTDDAIAVLDNVEVGYYNDYQNRKPKEK